MSNNFSITGFDELSRKLSDPNLARSLMESHLREQLDVVFRRARTICADPEIVVRMYYKIEWNGETCTVSMGPGDAVPFIREAHQVLRSNLSDVANAILDNAKSSS